MGGGGFAPAQSNYRWYEDDGNEAGATAAAAQNAALSRNVSSPNVVLRVMVQAGVTGGAATDDYQLQRSINGGAFADVNTSSTGVKARDTTNLTDAGATTSRLSGGVGGAFGAGKVSEDGLVDDIAVASNNWTDLVYSLALVSGDLANGDALTFRLLANGATFAAYTVTPTINVVKASSLPAAGSKKRLRLRLGF